MTPEQIALVQKSFDEIEPRAGEFVSDCYQNLFRISPGLTTLFLGNMPRQEDKLREVFTVLVHTMGELQCLLPELNALAVRHAAFGVQRQDYPLFGEALFKALEKQFGPRFSGDLRNAWTAAYVLVSDILIAGSPAPVR